MHPCDAKGIFFSEVEVLHASHTKRPGVAVRHVMLAGVAVDARVGAAWVVVLFRQNGCFCFSMGISFPLFF